MKIASIITSIEEAYSISSYTDAFIVPIKEYSINYPDTFYLEDVKEIKKLKKEIFIILNKNIYNKELEPLKALLKEIDKLNINGIIFYDIALIKLKKDLNLKTDLVWAQEHLVNNYGTINYYYEKGVKYAYLSSELTKAEIKEIKENSKAKLFINVFGYIPIFTSQRHLVNNYVDYFNLNERKKHKQIIKEGKSYPIIDDKHGTTVFSNYILNILDEDFLNDFYLVFNSNLIDNEDFKNVLISFKTGDKIKFPYEPGFLYRETIYKVKND